MKSGIYTVRNKNVNNQVSVPLLLLSLFSDRLTLQGGLHRTDRLMPRACSVRGGWPERRCLSQQPSLPHRITNDRPALNFWFQMERKRKKLREEKIRKSGEERVN